MRRECYHLTMLLIISGLLTSCSYNPFIRNNHTTGSPTGAAIGGGIGAGGVALLGGSKPLIALGGVAGGAIGYYATTLRYDAGGIIRKGGKVYKVGDFVGIYIPSDELFEPNTDDFLPQAGPILDSAAAVLRRYPNNNILISGNTSGFAQRKWELKISQARAQKVAAYMWDAGINGLKENAINDRKLNYVGYGDYFPIANHYVNKSIRQNSRIQITSYPSDCDLHVDAETIAFNNEGAWKDASNDGSSASRCDASVKGPSCRDDE